MSDQDAAARAPVVLQLRDRVLSAQVRAADLVRAEYLTELVHMAEERCRDIAKALQGDKTYDAAGFLVATAERLENGLNAYFATVADGARAAAQSNVRT